MLTTRVIPILLLKNRGLYKGVKFKRHSYIGDPINTIKIFNEKEVDELVILDIEASKTDRSIDFGYLQELVKEAFMPIAYGGGIKTLEDVRKLFSIGIEKVVLNTNGRDSQFIRSLVSHFGSQSIVYSLDISSTLFGLKAYTNCGTKKINENPLEIAKQMEVLGVGEIMLNSIDRDGTLTGYDLNLIKQFSSILNIPLIACGGCSSLRDIGSAKQAGAHAIGAGSFFVYHGPHKAVLISYPKYDDLRNILGEN